MKTLIITLTIGALCFAAVRNLKAQTNATAKSENKTNSVACALEINDRQTSVPNHTEADLRKALASLRSDETPYNLILLKGKENFIQVDCTGKDSFTITMQEGDEQHQYQATKNLSTDATMKLLLAFRSGDSNWKKLAEWKPL